LASLAHFIVIPWLKIIYTSHWEEAKAQSQTGPQCISFCGQWFLAWAQLDLSGMGINALLFLLLLTKTGRILQLSNEAAQ
jgi:hypothetical protein